MAYLGKTLGHLIRAYVLVLCAMFDSSGTGHHPRLLKDIGLFEISSGTTNGNDTPAATGASAGPRQAYQERATPPNPRLNSPSARTPREAQTQQAAAAAAAKTVERRKAEKSSSPDPPNAVLEYLTKVLAFPEADASRSLSNTSGGDLGEALDYLCLHTDEAALKKYFSRGGGGGGGKGGSGGDVGRDGAKGTGPGWKKSVAAGIEVRHAAPLLPVCFGLV